MGFKKEEIELALRATNLNLEEAIEILNQSRSANSMDAWRRHDEHNASAGNFEHNNFPQRYPGGPQQAMPFQVRKIGFKTKLVLFAVVVSITKSIISFLKHFHICEFPEQQSKFIECYRC